MFGGSQSFSAANTIGDSKGDSAQDRKSNDSKLNFRVAEKRLSVGVILVQRPDFSTLKDGRESHTDDKYQSHGPVDRRVIERVKDGEEDQPCRADNPEKDGQPIKDLLPRSQIRRQSIDVPQPPLGEEREDIESTSKATDEDKEGLVCRADIRDKNHTSFPGFISRFTSFGPEADEGEKTAAPYQGC